MKRFIKFSRTYIGAFLIIMMMSFTASSASAATYTLVNPPPAAKNLTLVKPMLQSLSWNSPTENATIVPQLGTPLVVNAYGVYGVGFAVEATDAFGHKYWKDIGRGTKTSTGVYSLTDYSYKVPEGSITILAYGINQDGTPSTQLRDSRKFYAEYIN